MNHEIYVEIISSLISIIYLATCFRIAKQLDQCKDCLFKAADCHKQNRALFHAARCFEQVRSRWFSLNE